MPSRAAALAGLLMLGGCALLMEGTSQTVTFTTDPPGAGFTVGGRTAVTPATLEIPKEDYTVVFGKPGYRPSEFELKRQVTPWFYGSVAMGIVAASVDVLSGAWQEFQTDRVHAVLEPLPDTTTEVREVELTSDPSGAEVLIGGAVQGRTPLKLSLGWRTLEGQKDATFRRAGYRSKTVPLKRGDATLGVELEGEPVAVRVHFVSVPPGADVKVDGRGVGRTPVYGDVTWLPKDPPRRVDFSKAGYRPETRTLAGPGQTRSEAELAEVFEETPLALSVFPPGARIELDGQPVTGREIRLRWSVSLQRHTVRVSHPGYRPQEREILFDARAESLELTLQPSLPKQP